MTTIEFILIFAVVVLAVQVFILQRYYGDRLSEQAVVLNQIIDLVIDKKMDPKYLNKIRNQIFNSSQ